MLFVDSPWPLGYHFAHKEIFMIRNNIVIIEILVGIIVPSETMRL